jgi:hypothetical protein
LVFASSIRTRLDRRNVLRWWHDLTVRADGGGRRFHASRHTAATPMLNKGVPLEVSATLGTPDSPSPRTSSVAAQIVTGCTTDRTSNGQGATTAM